MERRSSLTDYSFLQEALSRHFTPEQIEKSKFNKRTRLALSALDFEFFCRYYLPHHFDQQPAEFHRILFSDAEELMDMKSARNYLGVVFRGGAKTTIFNLALPLWSLCLGKRHFIVIVSDSERMAREKAAAIKYEIETNDMIREDFGELIGAKWADTEFETRTRRKVLALGSGMNIRGTKHYQHRPDLIILDDIESKEEVASPAQRRRLSDWFAGDVLAAGQPNTKLVVIGTYLSYDCVLKEMEKTPVFWRRRNFPAIHRYEDGTFAFSVRQDLWAEWEGIMRDLSNHNREDDAQEFYRMRESDMLEGVIVTWPERLPYYDLMVKRLNGRAAFNTEYLNEPSDPESRYFAHYDTFKLMAVWNNQIGPWLVPWRKGKNEPSGVVPVKLSDCVLFAATDPSMGMSTQADYSAIIILALDPKTGYRYVLEADLQRRPPSRIMAAQTAWYQKYPQIMRWVIESVQMQAFFKEQSGVQSLTETRGLPLVDYKTGATSKHMRIQSLQAPLENGYLMLCEDGQELLKEQLDQYLHTTHDDGPDALQMAYETSLTYKHEASPAVTVGVSHKFGEDSYLPFVTQDPYAYADFLAEQREKEERREKEPDNLPPMLIQF